MASDGYRSIEIQYTQYNTDHFFTDLQIFNVFMSTCNKIKLQCTKTFAKHCQLRHDIHLAHYSTLQNCVKWDSKPSILFLKIALLVILPTAITYTCKYSSWHLIPIIQSCQDELGICPLEYLQVQVITLLFITMIPISCKITNFSLYLFVCFFRDHHNYFLARAQ